MAGILENFFKITMVLTIILMGINMNITFFGYAMTGDQITGLDYNAFGTGIQTTADDVIEQTSSEYETSQSTNLDWLTVFNVVSGIVAGYQIVLLHIFAGDMITVGYFLVAILTMFQVIGAAYIPWALISAWRGGGSP